MNSNSKLPEISKEAFIKAREKLGLSTKDLGGMACLSTRQIEQIESGEMSSFYGAQIKFTAAKKVAKLLNLSDEDAFEYDIQSQDKLTPSSELAIADARLEQLPKVVEEKPVSPAKVEIKDGLAQVKESAKENTEPVKKVQVAEKPSVSTAVESKPKSQGKLFLWLSVIAAAAFAAINLRPLLFADKPEEIVIVKETVVESAAPAVPADPAPANPVTPAAVAPVVAVPATTAEVSAACPAEEGIISYKPEAPRKAGDMVYVQVKSKQVVCVSDASGKIQNKMLEPGVGASFYGKSPFKVLTGGLAQVDIYFQGAKVRLANSNYKTLVLDAAEVVAPSVDRTDSQQR
ncbi:MAG: helix-turn-helix transcriptional regulator [Polynucleobacter sp.]